MSRRNREIRLLVRIHQEDDLYVAKCVEVGTVSQGSTVEEALDNVREATELYLEETPELAERLLADQRQRAQGRTFDTELVLSYVQAG